MCDTMYLAPHYSFDGWSRFAKNSDRSPNEPLLTLRIPAAHHEPGETVRCTYIDVPQVERTREMILCKPSWIWGAEMGVNDAGVAIGNEAVFTKAKRGEPSLIGMDLLRLALERAATATEAVEVLIGLLETYGQGGNCGFDKEFHYDNSFLVCDADEGYVLETSGKNYALVKAVNAYALSNRLGIGADHVARAGAAPGEDFSKRFTEPVRSHFSQAKQRRCLVEQKLAPDLEAEGLMGILRTHAPGAGGREFSQGSVGSVCMHAGGMIGDHTTGSLVATLRARKPTTLWITGCSTPCIAAFKPVFWNSDAPPLFADSAASLAYWMKREHIHRAILAGKIDATAYRERIRVLERRWIDEEASLMSADVVDTAALAALSAEAGREEQALVDEFYRADWQTMPGKNSFNRYWQRKNEALGLERP
ncbi:peptidase U34 [Raoultibacter phocaeensis]|uniref:peptidase U34 n=1 Tax=Raoultibacter phocaeensis TaxID=2479841 RepID=UPI0011186103|nr:peptidase U34 [Raoultibacter phocaeensis]